MVSLEQIQALNAKVNKAIGEIFRLREENTKLRAEILNYEGRVKEHEALIQDISKDQQDIEKGILNILEQLDKIESGYSTTAEPAQNDTKTITPHKAPPLSEPASQAPVQAKAFLTVEPSSKPREDEKSFALEGSVEPEVELDIF